MNRYVQVRLVGWDGGCAIPRITCRRPQRRVRRPMRKMGCRAGLSLLEVMLAIAILGLSIAAMGELVRLGVRAAGETRELTKAQILCESKMSELAAGIVPLESVEQVPFELDPDWTWSVMVSPVDQEGLLMVQVMVEQVVDSGQQPVTFTLTRWMIDPALEQQIQEEEALLQQESGSSSGNAPSSGGAL